MSRAIDAVQALNNINRYHRPTPVSQFDSGFNQGLNQAMWEITHAPTLTPPNEWVSVDKKLPQCGVPVLIGNPHWDYPVVASYAGSGVWMDSRHQKMTFTPTCWMPLPAPPDRRPPDGEEAGNG